MVAGIPGNGTWTPAKIVGGGMAIPVEFTNQHGTLTDNEANTETFDDLDVSKGGPKNKDFLNCYLTVQFEDENGSGSFAGDAKVFIVGR